eukprot:1901001-Rhodomonas_salina.2
MVRRLRLAERVVRSDRHIDVRQPASRNGGTQLELWSTGLLTEPCRPGSHTSFPPQTDHRPRPTLRTRPGVPHNPGVGTGQQHTRRPTRHQATVGTEAASFESLVLRKVGGLVRVAAKQRERLNVGGGEEKGRQRWMKREVGLERCGDRHIAREGKRDGERRREAGTQKESRNFVKRHRHGEGGDRTAHSAPPCCRTGMTRDCK